MASACATRSAVTPAARARAWSFFISFETPVGGGGIPIQLEAKVNEYLDLVMAMVLAGDGVDLGTKRRDFDYYEAVTTHDSTLSAPTELSAGPWLLNPTRPDPAAF